MTTSSPGSDIDANRNCNTGWVLWKCFFMVIRFCNARTCPMILIMFENVARKVTDSWSLMPVAPFNKIDGHALGSDHLQNSTTWSQILSHMSTWSHQPRVVVSLAVMSPPSSRASGSVMDIPAKTNSNPPDEHEQMTKCEGTEQMRSPWISHEGFSTEIVGPILMARGRNRTSMKRT